jgi:hypothetical protein
LESEIIVENEVVERVLKELEKAISRDIVDCDCANVILKQIETKEEREEIQRAIVSALVVSSWTQRLYFVVRSSIMSILGAILTLAIFWYYGSLNIVGAFIMGIALYIFSLVVSRLFDTEIVKASRKIVGYLGKHNKLRDLVVNNC